MGWSDHQIECTTSYHVGSPEIGIVALFLNVHQLPWGIEQTLEVFAIDSSSIDQPMQVSGF